MVYHVGMRIEVLCFAAARDAVGTARLEIEVRDGGRLATVTWGDMPGNADGIEPTPEQADALFRLDARLENPASWLPASAWQDQEMRPFIASRYDACYETSENVGLDAVLATFPQPAEDLLRTHDRTERRLGQDGSFGTLNVWCSVITTDEARTLAAIFDEDAGIYSHENVFGQDYVVGRRSPNVPDVRLSMEPMLPHEPSP